MGCFHTHPYEASDPSISDLTNAYRFELGSCIAGTNDKIEVNCYTKKGEYNEKIHKEIYDAYINIQKLIPTNITDKTMDQWLEQIVKAKKKSGELRDRYFNKTKIAEELFDNEEEL